MGKFKYAVGDYGSDLKNGLSLSKIPHIQDLSHLIALIIEKLYKKDAGHGDLAQPEQHYRRRRDPPPGDTDEGRDGLLRLYGEPDGGGGHGGTGDDRAGKAGSDAGPRGVYNTGDRRQVRRFPRERSQDTQQDKGEVRKTEWQHRRQCTLGIQKPELDAAFATPAAVPPNVPPPNVPAPAPRKVMGFV